MLRKDFILDRYQLYEARAAGADAVLLIAECLDDCNLRALHNEAVALGMTPLVELYEPENLQRVLDAGATLDRHQQPRFAHVQNRSGAHAAAARSDSRQLCVLVAKAAFARAPTSSGWRRPASTRFWSAKR